MGELIQERGGSSTNSPTQAGQGLGRRCAPVCNGTGQECELPDSGIGHWPREKFRLWVCGYFCRKAGPVIRPGWTGPECPQISRPIAPSLTSLLRRSTTSSLPARASAARWPMPDRAGRRRFDRRSAHEACTGPWASSAPGGLSCRCAVARVDAPCPTCARYQIPAAHVMLGPSLHKPAIRQAIIDHMSRTPPRHALTAKERDEEAFSY